MKKKVLAAILFLLNVSIMSVETVVPLLMLLIRLLSVSSGALGVIMSTCTLHAGDSVGTYIITCNNREWI